MLINKKQYKNVAATSNLLPLSTRLLTFVVKQKGYSNTKILKGNEIEETIDTSRYNSDMFVEMLSHPEICINKLLRGKWGIYY